MTRRTISWPAVLAAAVLVVVWSAGARAQEPVHDAGSGSALLAALARVPDSADARQDLISWLDQDAIIAARPGAAQPGSGAGLAALLDSAEPAAELLLAALQGASSGDPDVLQRLASSVRWP